MKPTMDQNTVNQNKNIALLRLIAIILVLTATVLTTLYISNESYRETNEVLLGILPVILVLAAVPFAGLAGALEDKIK